MSEPPRSEVNSDREMLLVSIKRLRSATIFMAAGDAVTEARGKG